LILFELTDVAEDAIIREFKMYKKEVEKAYFKHSMREEEQKLPETGGQF
jgi:hypothetical protein